MLSLPGFDMLASRSTLRELSPRARTSYTSQPSPGRKLKRLGAGEHLSGNRPRERVGIRFRLRTGLHPCHGHLLPLEAKRPSDRALRGFQGVLDECFGKIARMLVDRTGSRKSAR